jgi:hypothetical protein
MYVQLSVSSFQLAVGSWQVYFFGGTQHQSRRHFEWFLDRSPKIVSRNPSCMAKPGSRYFFLRKKLELTVFKIRCHFGSFSGAHDQPRCHFQWFLDRGPKIVSRNPYYHSLLSGLDRIFTIEIQDFSTACPSGRRALEVT